MTIIVDPVRIKNDWAEALVTDSMEALVPCPQLRREICDQQEWIDFWRKGSIFQSTRDYNHSTHSWRIVWFFPFPIVMNASIFRKR